MAGPGVPLVVIHGFTAEGFLYAQTLSRLCAMGFRVVAIDIAGHGGTAGLPKDGANIGAYSALVGRVLDELGIRHALLAGHSMGGRLVTLIVQGDVSAVTAAVNAAVEQAIKKPASYAVIANPHEEIVKLVELSASRWKKRQQENPEEALESKNSSKK